MKHLFFSLSVLFFSLSGGAFAQWYEVTTDNFVITGSASKQSLEKYGYELEKFRVLMAAVTGQRQEAKEAAHLEVYLFANSTDFGDVTGEGKNIGGVYQPRLERGVFVANAAYVKSELFTKPMQIIKHEYVHHFTYKNGPFYYPLWYREGIAEFFESIEYENGQIILGKPNLPRILEMGLAQKDAELWKWEDVLLSTVFWRGRPNSDKASLYYAQSWFVVHHLQTDTSREKQLTSFLKKVSQGAPVKKTFESTFGISFEDFAKELDEKWESESLPLKAYNFPNFDFNPTVTVRRLSKVETRARRALLSSYFIDEGEEKELEEGIAKLKKDFSKSKNNIRILYRLAELNLEARKHDEVRSLLQKAQELYPNHELTLILEGKEMLLALPDLVDDLEATAALWDRVRAKYRAAIQVNPKSVLAQYEFADSYLNGMGGATEEALDAAIIAMELSPEPYRVPYLVAALLARLKYDDDALYLLRGLAKWSLNGEVRNMAHQVMAEIEDRRNGRNEITIFVD